MAGALEDLEGGGGREGSSRSFFNLLPLLVAFAHSHAGLYIARRANTFGRETVAHLAGRPSISTQVNSWLTLQCRFE
jgi:hypothetical protein